MKIIAPSRSICLALCMVASSACGSDDDGSTPDAGGSPVDGAVAQPDAGGSDAGVDTSALDAVCTPGFRLELEDTDARRSALFTDAMGGDVEGAVQEIGRQVCRILYRAPEEVPDSTHLTLIIRHAVGEVAWKAGEGADITVMISTDHLDNVDRGGSDVGREVRGILFHEMTHMYQHDDHDGGGVDPGLIEGIADFVRFRAGFPPEGASPDPEGAWNDGYRTTAFFLVWMAEAYPDSVYRLNLSMSSSDGERWSVDSFRTITGKTVDELWAEYVATFDD